VLDLRRDHVPASGGDAVVRQSQDRKIVALGGPAGEDDFPARRAFVPKSCPRLAALP
jgi:hypothetical protein